MYCRLNWHVNHLCQLELSLGHQRVDREVVKEEELVEAELESVVLVVLQEAVAEVIPKDRR